MTRAPLLLRHSRERRNHARCIGVVLPDLETARLQAAQALAEMAKHAERLPVAFGAVIRDENFDPICEVESVVRQKPLS
jgi:hypothetical protein